LPVLETTLGEFTDLLTLAVRQVQLGQRQSEVARTTGPPGTTRPAAAATGAGGPARALRERRTAREHDGDEHAGRQGTKSSHENLHDAGGVPTVWLIGRYPPCRRRGPAVKIV
jgi:hypothetical protein